RRFDRLQAAGKAAYRIGLPRISVGHPFPQVARLALQHGENTQLQSTDQGIALEQIEQITSWSLSNELEGKLNLRRVVCYEPSIDTASNRAKGAESGLVALARIIVRARRTAGPSALDRCSQSLELLQWEAREDVARASNELL
ncbi:hypothetical protein, partial [Klebsiella pneumoniae]|uniref:hypothetical protein n=1 Tax=Klebsiella pneumoniae TaxID=573 RepID=UPI003531AE1F